MLSDQNDRPSRLGIYMRQIGNSYSMPLLERLEENGTGSGRTVNILGRSESEPRCMPWIWRFMVSQSAYMGHNLAARCPHPCVRTTPSIVSSNRSSTRIAS
jgi:hypothetical protein